MNKRIAVKHARCWLTLIALIGCFLSTSVYAQFTWFQEISNTTGGWTEPYDDEPGNDDDFGEAVASIGDLDGDSIPDIVISASDEDDGGADRGVIWIVFLNSNGTVKSLQRISSTAGGFTGELQDGAAFGGNIGNLGDLDGDGITDIAVRAHSSDAGRRSGAVWILFLNSDGTVKANQKISATQGGFTGQLEENDRFGDVVVSPLGDLDGDGIPDLAVGARGDDDGGTDRGAVWILFLNRDGTVKSHQKISAIEGGFTGELDDGDRLGKEMESLGDLDGDGVADIAACTTRDDDGGTNVGAVWILFLNSNGTVKSHQKISATQGGFTDSLGSSDSFCETMVGMGDLDGDGVTDIAVGADYHNDGGIDTGAMWLLYLNSNGTVKSQQKISNSTPGFIGVLGNYDNFGNDGANIGDLNGDGVTELLVVADSDDGSGRWIPEGEYGHAAAYIFFLEGANGGGDGICPGVNCDNTDTGFDTAGVWSTSSFSPGYYGSNYLHDQNNGKGTKTASWTYAIAADGNYSIAGQWPAHPNRAAAVQYRYSVDGGVLQDCGAPVDQRINGGQFNGLCIAPALTAGSTLTVMLTNDAAGYVIADAVRVGWAGTGNIPPVAAFTASQVAGTLTVDFDASTSYDLDGTLVSYAWDFGDSSGTGSGVTPSYTYAIAGSYLVSLTVTDDQGATNTLAQTVTVQPIGGAVCPGTICDNTDTGFETVGTWATSSASLGYFGSNYRHDQNNSKGTKAASWTYAIGVDGDYEIAAQWPSYSNRAAAVQYSYSVDGGVPQNCGAPVDQRINGGQFNVLCIAPALTTGSTLSVMLTNDAAGYVIADAVRVEWAGAGGNIPPAAAFTASQVAGTLTVNFDASTSYDLDGTLVSYAWDFGDSSGTGSGVTPSYSYAAAGNYSVSLTVTDDQGATNTLTQTVTVQPIGGAVCPGTICDNTDTGFATVGVWATSSHSPGFYGSNYLHDQNNGKGSKTASWTYAIGVDGDYEIAAQWTSFSNRAAAVQYSYSLDGGTTRTNCGVPVDQRINGGQFNVLCTAPALAAGSTLSVMLTNDDVSGYVIADAVRLQ